MIPWVRTNRVVAAYSYFAGVPVAEEFFRCELRLV